MNHFDGTGDTSEEALHNIVFGDLSTPKDVEHIGEFIETPSGKVRLLTFPAVYSNPLPGNGTGFPAIARPRQSTAHVIAPSPTACPTASPQPSPR